MAKTEVDIQHIIGQFVSELQKHIRVQKVILYGSYAHGNQGEWSDIDLAIISDDFKRMKQVKRAELLALAHMNSDAAIEPIGYTLEEYKNASHLTFLGEIKRTGKVIYEAD